VSPRMRNSWMKSWTESARSNNPPASCRSVVDRCGMRVVSRCVLELCGVWPDVCCRASTRDCSGRITCFTTQNAVESFVETSRVQHYRLLVWDVVLSYCRPSPVCVLSLNDTGCTYMSRYTSYLAKCTSHFGTLPGFSLGDPLWMVPPPD